ncbi:MAG: hypothetical protein KJ795_11955 [Gammaproteobacteria bacterium]|nr:hypothetical protein [Gammaproteobacteria bacterium]MBU1776895.1 hypothetical protein [Gammaproteobacteria bacterium]MBU1968730.1 hypothetical protein [Gammaproteobacteria bacterium]
MKNINIPTRHSGAGRNPVDSKIPCVAGQHGLVRCAGYLFMLDSGLRRNDGAIGRAEE